MPEKPPYFASRTPSRSRPASAPNDGQLMTNVNGRVTTITIIEDARFNPPQLRIDTTTKTEMIEIQRILAQVQLNCIILQQGANRAAAIAAGQLDPHEVPPDLPPFPEPEKSA